MVNKNDPFKYVCNICQQESWNAYELLRHWKKIHEMSTEDMVCELIHILWSHEALLDSLGETIEKIMESYQYKDSEES